MQRSLRILNKTNQLCSSKMLKTEGTWVNWEKQEIRENFFIIIGFERNIKRGQVNRSSLLRSKNLELRTLRTFYQIVQ